MINLLESIFKFKLRPPHDHRIQCTYLEVIGVAVIFKNEVMSLPGIRFLYLHVIRLREH